MSNSTIKCPHCQQWNDSEHHDQQRCADRNRLLQTDERIKTRSPAVEHSFMDSLPPYAMYIFIGVVGVVGGIVVLALA